MTYRVSKTLTGLLSCARTGRLRDETLAIGKMLEKTMMEKYGPPELQQHYMVMDTICDATQARCSEKTGEHGFPAPFSAKVLQMVPAKELGLACRAHRAHPCMW